MSEETKKNSVFIFASPRMSYDKFSAAIAAAGLSKDQVIVIGSSEDLPHDIVLGQDLPDDSNMIDEMTKNGYAHNPNMNYRHLYLKTDTTSEDRRGSEKYTDHGAGYMGILKNHEYIAVVDGESSVTQSLPSLIQDLILGNK